MTTVAIWQMTNLETMHNSNYALEASSNKRHGKIFTCDRWENFAKMGKVCRVLWRISGHLFFISSKIPRKILLPTSKDTTRTSLKACSIRTGTFMPFEITSCRLLCSAIFKASPLHFSTRMRRTEYCRKITYFCHFCHVFG